MRCFTPWMSRSSLVRNRALHALYVHMKGSKRIRRARASLCQAFTPVPMKTEIKLYFVHDVADLLTQDLGWCVTFL